ncbi:MAG: putative N-acetylmannosamine-6-phosphate 2-epimerase [Geminicoccaceae bacterium]
MSLLHSLAGGLIVSCQPVRGGPLDTAEIVAATARAVAGSGAVGLRIESVRDIAAVTAVTSLPVIGLIKREQTGDRLFITPDEADVTAIARAGAAIIAFDATDRVRPVPVPAMVAAIHEAGCLAMADCARLEEGLAAYEAGADLIGSTLAGYTGPGPAPEEPDLDLVGDLAAEGLRVIAEGNIRTPAQALAARDAGAFAVVVGSAITRPEHVTGWFAAALAGG